MKLLHVDAVNQHPALMRLVKPRHQPADRCLPGSDPADDADLFASPDREGQPVKGILISLRIAEMNIFKGDVAAGNDPVDEARSIRRILGLFHDLVENTQ